MYYEEQVIFGVLYTRDDPNGQFNICTMEKLTSMLLEERKKSEHYREDALRFAALREAIGNLVPDGKG